VVSIGVWLQIKVLSDNSMKVVLDRYACIDKENRINFDFILT